MKILALSDLHSQISKEIKNIDYSNIDIICIAGDITNYGVKEDYRKIFKYFNQLNIPTFIVLGNHDNPLYFYEIDKNKYKNLHFLNNNIIKFNELNIYGTPYTTQCGWFNEYYTVEECEDLTIPKEKVDIIICHEPPFCKELGGVNEYITIGNNELLKYLKNKKEILVICGHCHEKGGCYYEINENKCYNVAKTYKIIDY